MATQPHPAEPAFLDDYRPAQLERARHDGWTVERQRTFLTVLSETGCISEAASQAGVSSRSAYRLRQHPAGAAFASAWDQALRLATIRLVTVSYERAIRGTVKEFWHEGVLRATTRTPSDKLLIFLLGHLLPRGEAPSRLDAFDRTVDEVRAAFPGALAALTDQDIEMVEINSRDYFPDCPGDPREDW